MSKNKLENFEVLYSRSGELYGNGDLTQMDYGLSNCLSDEEWKALLTLARCELLQSVEFGDEDLGWTVLKIE